MLRRITQSPYLNLLCGIILIWTAGYEILERLGEPGIRTHHGVAIFGLVQIVKSLPEIMHGLKECREGEEGFHKTNASCG